MAPKGDGVGGKKSATPSFVSMWPINVELLLMVTEVSKRKHILEFPLFKRTENQMKIEAEQGEHWMRRSLTPHKHTHSNTRTQSTMHTWTHTSKNVYLYGRVLEIDILSKYG